ncbi:MAG: asparagine synthase [Hyphomicrobiales bacterium]|nr:asparagine synthase [Hyphomicrobiales bacterium]MCP5373318.1 asparagine synthase [Hyphomicrobiales bacterium]
MSGLCGWIGGVAADAADAVLARMAAGLPDLAVVQAAGQATPAVGLALRARDREGAWHADGAWVAAVEGYPVWTDADLAALARAEGHAAALAQGFARHGRAVLDHLRGTFSLAVADAAGTRGLVAIDRFGIQPMCYARRGDGTLLFGSTTDSLRPFPGMTSTIRAQSVYNYLYFVDRIPAPKTIYEEQRKLLPGECLVFEGGRTEAVRYWRMPYREHGETDFDKLSAELHQRLRTAVARNLDGEDPARVGAFLSGGLDSSSVAGFLAEALPGQARTFTIGFEHDSFDETPYARVAAEHFATTHSEYFVTPEDVVGVMTRIHEIYDEPFANSSAVPTYFCALKAREAGVDMMLAGDGGDELFGGNSRYVEDNVFDRYGRIPAPLRRGLLEPLTRLVPGPLQRSVVRQAVNYVRFANMTVAERMVMHNAYARIPPARIYSAEAMAEIDPAEPARIANAMFDAADSGSKYHGMFHLDMQLTLADSDLRKVGRMCELAGVRVRYPLLDDEVAEFSARIAPDLMMRDGRLRDFYKRAMQGFLPERILTKKKHGFGIPVFDFIVKNKALNDLFCDTLGGLRNRSFYRPEFIDETIQQVRGGDAAGFGGAAWDLTVMEIWLRSRNISLT